MYDFWFTLGTAVMVPSFLTDVTTDAPPTFGLIARVMIESGLGSNPGTTTTFVNTTTAGLLQKAPTVAFRLAIRKHLPSAPGTPPTSIYTAGKLCQLLTVPIGFLNMIKTVSAGYATAVTNNPTAKPANFPAFPAFVGLLLIDGLLRAKFAAPDAELTEILQEFGLPIANTAPEFLLLSNYATNTAPASAALLSGVSTPWQEGACPDQIVYWEPQNDRAIL